MEKKSILLVDDDTLVRNMIKDALKKEYTVLDASGYSEAVKFLHSPIDLALIDYMLQDSDGFEVLKTFREKNPTLPSIIITGYGNENIVIKAIRTEVVDYIKKPIKLSYLKQRISQILEGNDNDQYDEKVKNKNDFILEGIAAFIEEKYMKDISLGKIASMACMNKFKFCKIFKEKFGQSYVSYLNGIRIKNAAEFLKNNYLSITEIAYIVGYRSIVHFDRMFRALHGISPREYRKRADSENIEK